MVKTPEQISAANQAAVETAMQLAQISMQNAERLVRLQLDAAKGMLADNLKNAQALTEVKDPQQLAALRAKALESGVEQMTAYSRSIYDLAAKTQAEFGKIMESRIAAFSHEVTQLVDEAAKSAPAGSAPAIAAMKQALATTNAMIETMTRAAKQFTQTADTNIKSATATAVNVAKSGAKKRK
ncbi:MAG: phasin family protein [Pseudomonadota bacterium]